MLVIYNVQKFSKHDLVFSQDLKFNSNFRLFIIFYYNLWGTYTKNRGEKFPMYCL